MIVSSWQLQESLPVFFLGGGEGKSVLLAWAQDFVQMRNFRLNFNSSTLDKFNMDFFITVFLVFHETCDIKIGDPRSFFHYSSVHGGTNICLGCMLHGIFCLENPPRKFGCCICCKNLANSHLDRTTRALLSEFATERR